MVDRIKRGQAPESASQVTAFGVKLRGWRAEIGLSQNALANKAGMDPTAYNRIERGLQGIPRNATLLKIASGLGIDPKDPKFKEIYDAFGQEVPNNITELSPDALQLKIAQTESLLFQALSSLGELKTVAQQLAQENFTLRRQLEQKQE